MPGIPTAGVGIELEDIAPGVVSASVSNAIRNSLALASTAVQRSTLQSTAQRAYKSILMVTGAYIDLWPEDSDTLVMLTRATEPTVVALLSDLPDGWSCTLIALYQPVVLDLTGYTALNGLTTCAAGDGLALTRPWPGQILVSALKGTA